MEVLRSSMGRGCGAILQVRSFTTAAISCIATSPTFCAIVITNVGCDLLHVALAFTSESMAEVGDFLFEQLTLVSMDGAGALALLAGHSRKLNGVDGGRVFGLVDNGAEAWLCYVRHTLMS